MGKTERILSNLPRTFRPLPRPSALFSLANAFGLTLQEAENLLVEVMKAHWVDYADRGRTQVRDLDLLASLYSLQSRPDEAVEEFREHLKRHVQTLLEGTATVHGILRVAADTLGLTIDPKALDHPTARRLPRADDASRLLFGVPWAEASGRDAQHARLSGRNDLSAGVDLRPAGTLALEIDGTTHTIDLAAGAARPEGAGLKPAPISEIVRTINAAFGAAVASHDGRYPILISPATGAAAHLALLHPDAPDAADPVFGLAPRLYRGSDARPAEVTGRVDLAGGADVSADRYLRVAVDGITIAEVVCAGVDPAATTLDEIVNAINTALGEAIASHDGHELTLRTSGTGVERSIEIQPAAANDAAERLFGLGAYGYYAGDEARPARATGRQMLNQGADLRVERRLALRLDGGDPVEIDCAGETPERTTIQEIVDRINAAVLPDTVASHDGVFLTLTSPTAGAAGSLEILTAPSGDGAPRILGFAPREASGADATPARIIGEVNLPPSLDLRLRRRIALAFAGQSTVEVDVAGSDPARATPDEIVGAINTRIGAPVASLAGQRLAITTVGTGAGQWVALMDRTQVTRSRFLSRAPVLDEAALPLFGFVEGRAVATAGQPGRLAGQVDLSAGVDLRATPYLRLAVDDQPPVDVDCRGDRPRLTRPDEIAARINAALGADVAGVEGGHLVIASPTAGRAGRVVVEPSSASDAAEILLGAGAATVTGRDATRVVFTATRDLSAGLHVSDRYLVRVGVDGNAPVDVDLRGDLATMPDLPDLRVDLEQLVDTLNAALGDGVASQDGRFITLRSSRIGPDSRIEFEAPADATHDATTDLFGISVPRTYRGAAATAARLEGSVSLSAPIDLSQRHHLRIAFDGQPPQDVDCAGATPAATTLAEVVEAIERLFAPDQASADGDRLVLTSSSAGAGSSVVISPSTAADAREAILGAVPEVTAGVAGTPAVLTGTVAPSSPLDLRRRGRLRIAVDDGPPRDVDARGADPARTTLEEVVAAINAAFGAPPANAIAALTPDGTLHLTGAHSVELIAPRALTLIEFPPVPATPVSLPVKHGTEWTVANAGVGPAPVAIALTTARGVVQPTFVDRTVEAQLWVHAPVGPGQALRIALDEAGMPRAEIDGAPVPVEATPSLDALRLPPGTSAWQYLECLGARFDHDRLDRARFVDGQCRMPGVFDVSRFAAAPDAPEVAVFAPSGGGFDSGTNVTLSWSEERPGRFRLELPYDLPEKYGARFDDGRFAGALVSAPDLIVETDPLPGSLIEWVNQTSPVLEARAIPSLPDGAVAQRVPWDQPVALDGGTSTAPARLFLTEDGLAGFIELRARAPGGWGNYILVTVAAGATAGAYAVTLAYASAAVYENAVQTVLAQILPARAAGIRSDVTRRETAE